MNAKQGHFKDMHIIQRMLKPQQVYNLPQSLCAPCSMNGGIRLSGRSGFEDPGAVHDTVICIHLKAERERESV